MPQPHHFQLFITQPQHGNIVWGRRGWYSKSSSLCWKFSETVWSQIAILFKSPYQRLLARANGRGDRSYCEGYNKALNIKQEAALCRILDRMEYDGMHCRQSITWCTGIWNTRGFGTRDLPPSILDYYYYYSSNLRAHGVCDYGTLPVMWQDLTSYLTTYIYQYIRPYRMIFFCSVTVKLSNCLLRSRDSECWK